MSKKLSTNAPKDSVSRNGWWLAASIFVVVLSVFFRFYRLELKPFHHDEGVNGHFLMRLFREGIYHYDPSNYHGPTLYYITLAFTKVFGLETYPVRVSIAIFGVLMVLLTLYFRRYLGSIGTLSAAAFIALSPGMVFISRYFIHEISFVFFSLGFIAGIVFFVEGKRPGVFATAAFSLILLICLIPPVFLLPEASGFENPTYVWVFRLMLFLIEAAIVFLVTKILLEINDGRIIYLLLASACAALLFATKETAFITIGTMFLAAICVYLWRKILRRTEAPDELAPAKLSLATFRERFENQNEFVFVFVGFVAMFVLASVVFFSSFFTYWEGIQKAFAAYAFWTKTGKADHTQNGIYAYAKWLLQIESPILFLSALGSLFAIFKARHRFAMFTTFWAWGLFAAYTLIPYKTPWLILSFLLPMCLIAGYGIEQIFASGKTYQKILGAILCIAGCGVLAYQTYDLNFRRYDDEDLPYVYAHTRRGFLDLMKQVEYYAQKSGRGDEATVEVVSPEYWPMPWYTRKMPYAVYEGRIVPINSAEMIIAQKDSQESEILAEYPAHYKFAGEYPLRPGVDLLLLVRRDLADPQSKEIFTSIAERGDERKTIHETVDITPENTKPPSRPRRR